MQELLAAHATLATDRLVEVHRVGELRRREIAPLAVTPVRTPDARALRRPWVAVLLEPEQAVAARHAPLHQWVLVDGVAHARVAHALVLVQADAKDEPHRVAASRAVLAQPAPDGIDLVLLGALPP